MGRDEGLMVPNPRSFGALQQEKGLLGMRMEAVEKGKELRTLDPNLVFGALQDFILQEFRGLSWSAQVSLQNHHIFCWKWYIFLFLHTKHHMNQQTKRTIIPNQPPR